MDFTVVEAAGIPYPVFEGSTPDALLRAAFLRDLRHTIEENLESISLVKQGRHPSLKSGGDEVWVEFCFDRVTITAQWMYDENGSEMEIQLSLAETEQLLHKWQAALSIFESHKNR